MHDEFLQAGVFVDSGHPAVVDFAQDQGRGPSDRDKALALYYAIRDGFRYDPYMATDNPDFYRASGVLEFGRGWCVPKAALLAACARVHNIPARPGYADVVNHLATPELLDALGDTVFYWHSYCELFLEGKWVKATPAFNKELCDKFGLQPLEFDGRTDSLFHEFDRAGNRHMEYLNDRGTFADAPYEAIVATFREKYKPDWIKGVRGNFEKEATASRDAAL